MRNWLKKRDTVVVVLTLIVFAFASAWSTISVVNAVSSGGEGSDGGVFWPAVAIVALAAFLLLGLTGQALVELVTRVSRRNTP